MHARVASWLKMSRGDLDELYKRTESGTVPDGDTSGTAIVLSGSFIAGIAATCTRWFAWKGKVFDIFAPPDRGILINKISPFGVKFIVAKVYKGESWMDGKETIIIDYSKTSFFAGKIRDEIREVEPGVYLGKVWLGKLRVIDFALVSTTKRESG